MFKYHVQSNRTYEMKEYYDGSHLKNGDDKGTYTIEKSKNQGEIVLEFKSSIRTRLSGDPRTFWMFFGAGNGSMRFFNGTSDTPLTKEQQ
jgi:hypothetical protein